MTQHTPGPWHIASDPKHLTDSPLIQGRYFRNVAKVLHNNGSEDSEVNSNAHLITAAPDLLEALNFIVSQITNENNAHHTLEAYKHGVGIDMAKKAIAKARGK